MQKKIYTFDFADRKVTFETGQLAKFANGSVLVRYGDTTVLTTVTAAKEVKEGVGFFPLQVDYEEKMYAVGRIPGGFLRREGRPTENAILTSRSIDRSIRPHFPHDLRRDVVINNLVLSVDNDYSPQVAAMLGTSLAVSISDVPWNGPVAAVQIALVNGEVVINPTVEQNSRSDLDLFLSGTAEKICMIEAGANEVPDEVMLDAIAKGHEVIKQMCRDIASVKAEIGKEPFSFEQVGVPDDLLGEIKEKFWQDMREGVLTADKDLRDANVEAIKNRISAFLHDKSEDFMEYAGDATDKLEKAVVREYLLKDKKRVDGRSFDEIRPLSCEIDIVPRVHGSSLFTRGQTQVLNICTLGMLSDAQKLDGMDPVERKRYMHQYNFPAYSVGEARANRSPGRREIGHGALAERALVPVLPSEEEFPYAMRLVSEVTMSNGSTSQGSICASTLSLMAAGVPIKRPVAGISCGLITGKDTSEYDVFMDIQGIEDFFGDMDFKVAGTSEGITAIQVDIKVDGLTLDIIRDAFAMTKKGRMQIINDVILPCISAPRPELSPFAPKIDQIDVPSDKIRDIIGSGGKNIRRITELSGAQIDIEEDGAVGHVFIAANDSKASDEAIKLIKTIAYDPKPGMVFDGIVTSLMSFGAFVEIAPGKEGLVHISKMSWDRVDKVEDVVKQGDKVKVVVSEIDDQGRLNLSMRDLMEKPADYVEPQPQRRHNKFDNNNHGRLKERHGGSKGNATGRFQERSEEGKGFNKSSYRNENLDNNYERNSDDGNEHGFRKNRRKSSEDIILELDNEQREPRNRRSF